MKKLIIHTFLLLITFTVTFSCSSSNEEVNEQPVRIQYTLTVTAGEGGIITPDATGTYDKGSTITLSATPYEGYVFERWKGSDFDNSGCGFALHCRTAITIDSNRDVQAFFKSNTK